jgi:hypothetical protein
MPHSTAVEEIEMPTAFGTQVTTNLEIRILTISVPTEKQHCSNYIHKTELLLTS